MESWSVHHLKVKAKEEGLENKAISLSNYAQNLRNNGFPVIFSLAHLSKITSTPYKFLNRTVNRKQDHLNYSIFRIRKRSKGFRFIHAVNGRLLEIQKFINEEILQKTQPHHSSFAFAKNGGIKKCADMHLGCKWLIKFDLKDFFTSITEKDVYKVFLDFGYSPLLSFELARLCTTLRVVKKQEKYIRTNSKLKNYMGNSSLAYPFIGKLGVLPQGAPTSPMLSNLVVFNLDEALNSYAIQMGFAYTRYADDLTFSAFSLPIGVSIRKIIHDVYSIIIKHHFIPNVTKTSVKGPGSRKLVLGMLVDGDRSRVSKFMRHRIERILYSIEKYGLDEVAKHDNFDSPYGFCNHVNGLLAYLKDVDLKLFEKYRAHNEKSFSIIDEFNLNNIYEYN